MSDAATHVWAATAEAVEALSSPPVSPRPPAPGRDGARIYVRGVLTREPCALSELFGASTYQEIGEALAAALTDGHERIVLDIDSPGGDVSGAHDLAQAIYDAPAEVVAEVSGDCCSAAYWLASACDRIDAAETSVVGSVGVLVVRSDSRAVTVSALSPRKGLADDPQWLDLADDLGRVMLGDVARFRGLASVEDVSATYGGGAIFSARRALALGLVDSVGSRPAATKGGAPVALKSRAAATAEPVAAETVAAPMPEPAASPEPESVESLKARKQALELELAGIDAKLKVLEGMEEVEPVEAPEMPEPMAAALAVAQAQIAELRAAHRDSKLDLLIAQGRMAPGDRAVAAVLYEHDRPLFDSRYVAAAPGSAVPLGRVSHAAAVPPPPVETDPRKAMHAKVLAHIAANPGTPYHVAAARVEQE